MKKIFAFTTIIAAMIIISCGSDSKNNGDLVLTDSDTPDSLIITEDNNSEIDEDNNLSDDETPDTDTEPQIDGEIIVGTDNNPPEDDNKIDEDIEVIVDADADNQIDDDIVETDGNPSDDETPDADDDVEVIVDNDPVNPCEGKNYDDGNKCNGTETCNPLTGEMVVGTPLSCNDNNVCNGEETCNPATGCETGIPLSCNDGLACNGVESCDMTFGCENPPDVQCGAHGSCVEPAGSCGCTDGYTGNNCEVAPVINHAPEIKNLTVNPNPALSDDITTINFDLSDVDKDNLNWEITLQNGLDGHLSTFDGTCDTDTHCYGTTVDGNGDVVVTFNTGSPTDATITINSEDGKGGSDSEEQLIGVN